MPAFIVSALAWVFRKFSLGELAGFVLKNRQSMRREKLKILPVCPLYTLNFRQNGGTGRVCFVKYKHPIRTLTNNVEFGWGAWGISVIEIE